MSVNIAIIPARYGSKRLKNKNIKIFYKKPIIQWTFEILNKSNIFSHIIVSTESKKIIEVCKKIGIKKFINRPKKLSGDFVGTQEVIEHSINEASKKIHFDNVCCVYPCNPFLKVSNLKKALKLVKRNRNYFIQTISKFRHPPEQSFKIDKNGELKPIKKNNHLKMTQTFEPKYHDLGQFYFASKNTWLKKNKKVKIGLELSLWETLDIDYKEDWEFAKLLFKINNSALKF